MMRWWHRFFDMCLFRAAPQDLPYSGALVQMAGAAYIATGVLVLGPTVVWSRALLQSSVEVAVLLAGLYGLLQWKRRGERFAQTASALLGTGAVLGLLGVPVLYWLRQAHDQSLDPSAPFLLLMALVGWNLTVIAHILRHALETTMGIGMLYAGGLMIMLALVIRTLFPEAAV